MSSRHLDGHEESFLLLPSPCPAMLPNRTSVIPHFRSSKLSDRCSGRCVNKEGKFHLLRPANGMVRPCSCPARKAYCCVAMAMSQMGQSRHSNSALTRTFVGCYSNNDPILGRGGTTRSASSE